MLQSPAPLSPYEVTSESPCVGHCTTVLGDDVCRSCRRTFDEIIRWPGMSEDERRAVNYRIALELWEQSAGCGGYNARLVFRWQSVYPLPNPLPAWERG